MVIIKVLYSGFKNNINRPVVKPNNFYIRIKKIRANLLTGTKVLCTLYLYVFYRSLNLKGGIMKTVYSYTEIRGRLKSAFDQTCERHEPVRVSRRHGGGVVILSEEDFASLEETAYLLKSPANARRLLDALGRKGGKSLGEVKHALGI
jgi:antitoxin YefM